MSQTNVFNNVLEGIQAELKTNLKYPVMIGDFRGSESIKITPVSYIQTQKYAAGADYQFKIYLDYKTNKKLSIQQLTQEAQDIRMYLDRTPHRVVAGATIYFDLTVEEVEFTDIDDSNIRLTISCFQTEVW